MLYAFIVPTGENQPIRSSIISLSAQRSALAVRKSRLVITSEDLLDVSFYQSVFVPSYGQICFTNDDVYWSLEQLAYLSDTFIRNFYSHTLHRHNMNKNTDISTHR